MKLIQVLLISALPILASCQSEDNNDQTQEKQATQVIEKGTINEQEITWNPDFEAALSRAKALDQLLFVEAFSPTCPVCQTMEPFFKNPEVAKMYNTNFVNYKLDVGKEEQVKHLNSRDIFLPSFPKFLFFNGAGKLVHSADVIASVESINKAASTALNPEKRASNYNQRFTNGDRDILFLSDMASYARVSKDTAMAIRASDALYEVFPKNELNSRNSWNITKKCVIDLENGFAKHWFNNYEVAKKMEEADGHGGNQDNILGGIIQSTLYSDRGRNYSTAQLNNVANMMDKVNAGQYSESFLWELRVKANIKENKLNQALKVGNRMNDVYKGNSSAKIYITSVFNDFFPNAEYTVSARKWLDESLSGLKEDSQKANYYLQSARVYQKAGELTKALSEAEKGLKLANTAGLPNAKWRSLIAELKKQ